MTEQSQRIAMALLDGFVWYKQAQGIAPLVGDPGYWGVTRLALPPEDGIANPACYGLITDTRYATEAEIAAFKASEMFYTYAPDYLRDLNAVARVEAKVLDGIPQDAANPHALRYAYAHQLYNLVVPKDRQPFRASARERVEALLKATDNWKEQL